MSVAEAVETATETPQAASATADQKAVETAPHATGVASESGQDQSKAATLLTAEDTTSDAKPESPVVPEAYEVALPKDSPLSPDVLAKVSAIAKGIAVTDSAVVQQMVDVIHAEAVAVMEAQQAALKQGGELWTQHVRQLESEALADKDIGGTPERLKASIGKAQSVLKEFGSPEFAAMLDETGYGSHPALIKLLAKVKDAMGEDTVVQGEVPKPKPKSAAQAIYPDLPSKDG